jgi:FtsZ-interacting cell division protein ZipA
MFNLAEILTLIIGLLLALVFVDGIRRSLRTRRNKLKVDILDTTIEKEEIENLIENPNEALSNDRAPVHEDQEPLDALYDIKRHKLIIFNICSEDLESFSHSVLSEQLASYRCFFEDKGFFTFRDIEDQILFSLINAKNPGTFLEEMSSSDIALVLDPSKSTNVVESFNFMFSVAESLAEIFSCSLLDDNRNLLTKQMLEHMRNKAQEYQLQHLANAS